MGTDWCAHGCGCVCVCVCVCVLCMHAYSYCLLGDIFKVDYSI